MFNNKVLISLVISVSLSTSLFSFNNFSLNLNDELQRNTELIQKYKKSIENLEKRNKFLLDEKAKNPSLYVTKKLYEDTKESYIYRIKLNGAEANKVSFTIKNHHLSIEMNIKKEEKSKDNYFASSQYFSQIFSIPNNVDESKIKHEIDGDYFVITMPKNKN